jgi:hypothetical protein
MKNILVKFECQIGDYQHIDYMLFNKKKSEWGYCKEFWGISKKDELKEKLVFGMIGCRTLSKFIQKQK